MPTSQENFITSTGNAIVDLYHFKGLNAAIEFFYTSLQKSLPIHKVECIAKPYNSLWFVKLATFPMHEGQYSQIKTFDSLMLKSEQRVRINSQENNTDFITKNVDPYFFEVNNCGTDHILCNFLLDGKQSRLYIYIYPEKKYIFTKNDANFISKILYNLTQDMHSTFIFPSPFRRLPSRQDMESASSLLQLCPDMKTCEVQIRRIAPTDSLVLVTGESGTGKDLIAKSIHEYSPRRDAPFVKVNCGAIPDTLLDSELFGYEKGAFTGADRVKSGYFEQAGGGTIFLDEVGELSLAAQVRLLHVLENGQIQRVGSQETKKVDIRVIAATNKDLWAEVERGNFREDLCYRLFVCHVHVPPLRERKNDIPVLIWYFLNKKSEKMNIPPKMQILEDEIQALCTYDWPGNVRELEHTLERALIYSGDSPTLNIKIHTYQKKRRLAPPVAPVDRWPTWEEYTAAYLRQVLEHTGGRVKGPGGAAELLHVNPHTLRSRLLKLGLLEPRRK